MILISILCLKIKAPFEYTQLIYWYYCGCNNYTERTTNVNLQIIASYCQRNLYATYDHADTRFSGFFLSWKSRLTYSTPPKDG